VSKGAFPWRRHLDPVLGRFVYDNEGNFLGVFDTSELAELAVYGANEANRVRQAGERVRDALQSLTPSDKCPECEGTCEVYDPQAKACKARCDTCRGTGLVAKCTQCNGHGWVARDESCRNCYRGWVSKQPPGYAGL
jgi:hypothetical protein